MHSNIKIINIQLLDQRKIPSLKSLCIKLKIKQSYSLMTELKSKKKLNFFFLNFLKLKQYKKYTNPFIISFF